MAARQCFRSNFQFMPKVSLLFLVSSSSSSSRLSLDLCRNAFFYLVMDFFGFALDHL